MTAAPEVHWTGDQYCDQNSADHDQQQSAEQCFGMWWWRRRTFTITTPQQVQYVFAGIEPSHGVFLQVLESLVIGVIQAGVPSPK